VQVSVEKLPTSEAVLEIEVAWDEIEKASEKVYREVVKKVNIRGFRRGKAPRALLERELGKEYIYQEALRELVPEAYRKAVQEHDLTPISQPKLEVSGIEIGQPYHLSLTVPILTSVVLPNYQSLHFEREEASVTSEEIDAELESFRQQLATWEEVQRSIQYRDRIKADLKLTAGEKMISDLKNNVFEIAEERPGLFAGMDEYLIGMVAGEDKSFTTIIPADYTNEKLAGKEAHYDVVVRVIEEKRLPELDDAFAAKASSGQYETLEDWSKSLSDAIIEKKKRQINLDLREKVLDAVTEQSALVVHALLVEEQIKALTQRLGQMLEPDHLKVDQYLKLAGKSHEELVETLRPEAEKRAKHQLVLEEVARLEDITVTPEEVQAVLRAYAQAGQQLPRTEDQMRALASTYRREKALSRLIELTTDPDPDAEVLDAESADAEDFEAGSEESDIVAQANGFVGAEDNTEIDASSADTQSVVFAEAESEFGRTNTQPVVPTPEDHASDVQSIAVLSTHTADLDS
jgi:trigger factor